MKAKDCPIGMLIKYKHTSFPQQVEALMVGPNIINTLIAIGWLPHMICVPNMNWLTQHEHSVADWLGCNRGRWLISSEEVEIIGPNPSHSVAVPRPSVNGVDGEFCKLCRNFAPMATVNRPDGKSFICYNCRQNWIPMGI